MPLQQLTQLLNKIRKFYSLKKSFNLNLMLKDQCKSCKNQEILTQKSQMGKTIKISNNSVQTTNKTIMR